MGEDVQGWGTATGEAHTMGTAEGDGKKTGGNDVR